MSEIAQRIVTSHKEAAKRATGYLVGARRLKLKHAEALELVARVLGAANWQTLNAMAQQGKAPRGVIAENSVTEIVSLTEDRAAELLAQHYTSRGWTEHPAHLREQWANCDSGTESDHGYWRWVYRRMLEDEAMMPWEREGHPDIQIARAGGVDIDFDPFSSEWVVASAEDDEFLSLDPHDAEAEAWREAAAAVALGTASRLGREATAQWDNLTQAQRLQLVRKAFPHVIRAALKVQGFAPSEDGKYLVKKLKVGEMPYAREHIVDNDLVSERCEAVVKVTSDNQVQMVIGNGAYFEEIVPLSSEEGLGLLIDAGFRLPE
jgi:hypothetical protein